MIGKVSEIEMQLIQNVGAYVTFQGNFPNADVVSFVPLYNGTIAIFYKDSGEDFKKLCERKPE